MDHTIYLLVAFLTHALVGYVVVARLTGFPPAVGVAGALLPDVDLFLGPVLGLPVVHRGALHTPAAGLVLAAGVWLLGSLGPPGADAPRRVAAAVGIGVLTHLLIDSFTDAGIMWLYPASPVRASLGVPIHGPAGTAALWLSSLTLLLAGPAIRRRLRERGYRVWFRRG